LKEILEWVERELGGYESEMADLRDMGLIFKEMVGG